MLVEERISDAALAHCFDGDACLIPLGRVESIPPPSARPPICGRKRWSSALPTVELSEEKQQ